MLEYVKRLLLAQTQLAAQFDAGQPPEIRETALRAENMQEEKRQTDAAAPGAQKKNVPAQAQPGQAQEQTVEDQLREMTRKTMRMESMQMQKAAQAQQEQTRELEAAMTALQGNQTVDLGKQTPESAEGGLTGSYWQTMTVAGIASGPSQRSMQEISRFFERDARRYG